MCLRVVCGGVLFFQCLRMIFIFLAFKNRRTGKSRCSFLNMDVLPDKCECVLCESGWYVGMNFSVLRLIVFKLW
jgi:hypothetical protein